VSVEVTLKRPRVASVAPLDFVSGELIEREGKPTDRFRGHVIYFTNADVTVRRPFYELILKTCEIVKDGVVICAIVIYARRYENKFCIMHGNLLLDS
jgi:hypothetical protein